ncbi:DUF599 domain-containing protein [Haliangium sp.]|uniref:DUF599 domain-containing protein n=1 Tax=Haliangium sp. TaxID=2663208 RepID=UPI003D1236B9
MLTALDDSTREVIGFGLSAGLLAGYHVYLAVRLAKNPDYTIQSVNRSARTAWIEHVMSQQQNAILGVQTLRNSTMTATFLASTAVLLIIGALNMSSRADDLAQTWNALSIADAWNPGLWVAKLLLLVADFFAAFFCFAQCIRLFNHVGYQLAVPQERRPASVTPGEVAAHLNRAGLYYTLGMRAYYVSVPLVFWLFGPHLMLLATMALLVLLYYIDRMPKPITRTPPGHG